MKDEALSDVLRIPAHILAAGRKKVPKGNCAGGLGNTEPLIGL